MLCCVFCIEMLLVVTGHKKVVIFTFMKFKLHIFFKFPFTSQMFGLKLYFISMNYVENSEALIC